LQRQWYWFSGRVGRRHFLKTSSFLEVFLFYAV